MKTPIPPEEWSRDHWTIIAYAFCRLGQGGQLDRERMRTNPGAERYPTRTRSGTVEGHDDLDCLADAESAGVLVNMGTGTHPAVRFTTPGLVLGQWLCGAMTSKTFKTAELTWEAAVSASGFDIATAHLGAAKELSSIDAAMHEGNVECCEKDADRADEIEAGEHVIGADAVDPAAPVLAREACLALSSRKAGTP